MQTIKDVGPNLKSFYYHTCAPEDPALVRGSVLVLHGVESHGGRYGPLGEELAKNGYAMFAIDNIGHGLTVRDKADDNGGWKKEDLGKWTKDDFDLSTYNAYYLVDVIKRKYPGQPIYLLGDDHGGVMAQYMIGKYKDAFDGVIIVSCGMPSGKDFRMFIKSWIKKVCLYDENKSKGAFKSRTAFLNHHFKPTRTKYDWLNSVPEEVDRFIEDPLAGYVGTIGYYYYQYKYIVSIPRIIKFKKINKELPIMFIGGKDDYITKKGKNIIKLKKFYNKKGFKNTEIQLYEKSRHDVLLEWNKEQVAEDIANFINKNSYKEEVVEKETKAEVIVLNNNIDSYKSKEKETIEITLKEEEPEDELKLSTELKK